tara:strand:+ start:283 stop:555 length:273 start_codon:yes stop_codon:yes gene_type:complete
MGGYKKEMERQYTFHQVIAEDDHSKTVDILQSMISEENKRIRDAKLFIANLLKDYSDEKTREIVERLSELGPLEWKEVIEWLEEFNVCTR